MLESNMYAKYPFNAFNEARILHARLAARQIMKPSDTTIGERLRRLEETFSIERMPAPSASNNAG